MIVRGLPASPGQAAGRCWLAPIQSVPSTNRTSPSEVLQRAVETVQEHLRQLASRLQAEHAPEAVRCLVEAHLLLLRDPALVEAALDRASQGSSAEDALISVTDEALALLRGEKTGSGSAPADDVLQLRDLLLRALAQGPGTSNLALVPPVPGIVVAHRLHPLDLFHWTRSTPDVLVRALCLDTGTGLDHLAILARQLGIPTVVGLLDLSSQLNGGEEMLVNGSSGEVVIEPDREALRSWARRRPEDPSGAATGHAGALSLTPMANLTDPGDGPRALALGAEGVGLLRTEFLLDAHGMLPTEDHQLERYSELLGCMGHRQVTVRLLDHRSGDGASPELGLRGVRWLMKYSDQALGQLRALCRAARRHPEAQLRLLVPFISHPDEMDTLRRWTEQCWRELLPGVPTVPIGAMIETPAAALALESVMQHCDFIAVGTNDLLQLLVGANRLDPTVADWLDPNHPALELLLRRISLLARQANIPTTFCGELASDPAQVPRLVAMGYRTLSVSPVHLGSLLALRSDPTLDTGP
ncbi:MAG: phosphoenolpyruvate-utilizing N-terminal domain-containing protein, partial [Myxococcota bacterium]|nr:phosphoenolpyruvate-utilizing N-terminal domain-containing protein [Myxococcota bacterium]